MTVFVLKRLATTCLTLLLASLLVFFATQLLPGDVTTMVLGRWASEQSKTELRHELGLDRSPIVQYGTWLQKYVTGDWGNSISSMSAVRPVVLQSLRNSLMLALVAYAFYVPLGVTLGLVAALRRERSLDHGISVGSLAFIGLPEFVSAIVLIAIFSLKLGLLPAQSSIQMNASFVEAFPMLILPAVTVSLVALAHVVRMTRASTVGVLTQDYVMTATLKGLGPRRLLVSHVLRNSLLPTVTVVAMSVGWLVGGLIVTESVYSYPGLGRLLLFAIQHRDLPLIQATAMIMVLFVIGANFCADIVYAWLNPRIRYS